MDVDEQRRAGAREWVADAERITVLTGAGISTDSGHPRLPGPERRVDEEPGGREDGDDPALPGRPRRAPGGVAQPQRQPGVPGPSPTPATRPIVELERQGKLHAVVTQNVDGLHQKAGLADELVVEVHGTIWWTRCWDCQDRRPMAETLARVDAGEEDPPCEVCGGILKSDTISFGQALVPEVIDRAMQVSEECDLLLAVGSTLSRLPGRQLRAAGQAGRRPGRHRQRRPDRDGRHRRRRPATARSARSSRRSSDADTRP